MRSLLDLGPKKSPPFVTSAVGSCSESRSEWGLLTKPVIHRSIGKAAGIVGKKRHLSKQFFCVYCNIKYASPWLCLSIIK